MPSIREHQSGKLSLGNAMPEFSLKNVDETTVHSKELTGKAFLIAFTCNHCPYVKGSEAMMVETIKEYLPQGLTCIAISANDPVQYPEDSFVEMQKHAKEAKLPYPYLFDETQGIARAFDAECTPELYLFDASKKLIFHGTINDSLRDVSKVTINYLENALKQVFNNETVSPGFVRPLGCSIKWKLKV